MKGWNVPIKLIDVKRTIDICSNSVPDIAVRTIIEPTEYGIISYYWDCGEWSAKEIDIDTGKTKTNNIRSCYASSFLSMLNVCKEMNISYVWIDVVCVEQEDGAKKTMQLAEMGHYYSHAKRCIVFPDGLNMYTTLTTSTGGIGRWYTRVWTVQEGALTRNKKAFVHAIPRCVLRSIDNNCISLSDNDCYTGCIKMGIGYMGQQGQGMDAARADLMPDVSDMLVIIVDESSHRTLLDSWCDIVMRPNMPLMDYYKADYVIIDHQRETIRNAVSINHSDITAVARESMSRFGRFKEDKVYSIMTILGISLDVAYADRSVNILADDLRLRELVRLAATRVRPIHLAQLIVVNWYDMDDDCRGDCALPREGWSNSFRLPVSGLVDTLSYSITDGLTISSSYVRAKNITDVVNPKWQRPQTMRFDKYGRPFVVDLGNKCCKARGYIRKRYFAPESDKETLLILIGESCTHNFVMDCRYMSTDICSIDTSLVIVVHKDSCGVLHKIGMLHLPIKPRSHIWDTGSHTLCR
jgi:hypothetical protein